jgi:hypothetical protein
VAHAETAEPPRTLATRLFDAAPVTPLLAGVALAALLLGLLLAVAWLSGDLDRLASKPEPWWQNRDARLAILVSMLAAAVATATRYHALGTRENLAEVARLGGWRVEDIDPASAADDRLRERRAGLIGALVVPVFALLVDRDPGLYFRAYYWEASKVFTWVVAVFTTAGWGVLCHRAIRDARHFSALAGRLPEIDLLDASRLAPFAHQGLRSAAPGLLMITFVSLNVLDQGFLLAISAMGGLGILAVVAALAIPLRGVRGRVQRAKREELDRIHAAIRGDATALAGSMIEARERPGLADLLAYRAQVAAVPEWPLDPSTLVRVALYVAIPAASWIGAALVERALDAALQ